MKRAATRWMCRFLVAALAVMPFYTASAAMIGTQEALHAPSANALRGRVVSALDRTDVARELQSLGVDAGAAKARVAAMTDEEVQALAGQIDLLPAGANSVFWWAAAIAAIIALYIIYKYK